MASLASSRLDGCCRAALESVVAVQLRLGPGRLQLRRHFRALAALLHLCELCIHDLEHVEEFQAARSRLCVVSTPASLAPASRSSFSLQHV